MLFVPFVPCPPGMTWRLWWIVYWPLVFGVLFGGGCMAVYDLFHASALLMWVGIGLLIVFTMTFLVRCFRMATGWIPPSALSELSEPNPTNEITMRVSVRAETDYAEINLHFDDNPNLESMGICGSMGGKLATNRGRVVPVTRRTTPRRSHGLRQ